MVSNAKNGTNEVGYGKPPQNFRFKKGQSGNPGGRPKGALNLATVLARILREKIVIDENGKRKAVTKLEAAIKQLTNKAASGELKAVQLLAGLVRSAEERAIQTDIPNSSLDEVDQKVVLGILKRLETTDNGEEKMAMTLNPSEYRAFLRQDLYAFTERCFYELNPAAKFLPNWHIQVIASALEDCRRGETKRLIINQPPRSLKSQCASVAFVAFLLGHDPTAQIICSSYGQELANKHALDCRTIMSRGWYQALFPRTRLSPDRQSVQEFMTTQQGYRLSTSVGGVLTGRGANFLIIDDPLKPEEALSDSQRKACNEWFDHTLYSRLNNKKDGCIIIIMQRLHEDDLVGHVLGVEPWKVVRFPAIAEKDETHVIETPYGTRRFTRGAGEALHPEREPLEVLNLIREALGEYNFAGQYLQEPSPLGGGLVKAEWFKTYTAADAPHKFEMILQSWDSANKPTELSDYSVCTTWGIKEKHIYLLNVCRKRLGYPELKRTVREQAEVFGAQTILIEDRASGTQLIQELVGEGMYAIKRYEPTMDKIMRMHSVTNTIENGFVHLPDKAFWLGEYLHELMTFPKGKHDDQADSTSQALDWFKMNSSEPVYGLLDWWKQKKAAQHAATVPASRTCSACNVVMNPIPGGLRCPQCGIQWPPPGSQPRPQYITRADVLNGRRFR